MTRHQLFGMALVTALCLALAGPAVAQIKKELHPPILKQAPLAPIQPAPAVLSVVKIVLKNDKRSEDPSSFSRPSLSNYFELALTKGGNYTATVTYKNDGSSYSKAMKGTLKVELGLPPNVSTQDTDKDLPIIAPHATKILDFPLGSIGGTTSNPVQIKITAGWK